MIGQIRVLPRVIRLIGWFGVDAKMYDGTNSAAISSNNLQFDNLIPGFQAIQLINPVAEFKSTHLGVGKRVELKQYSATGPDTLMYQIDRSTTPYTLSTIHVRHTTGNTGNGNHVQVAEELYLNGMHLNSGLNLLCDMTNSTIRGGDSLRCNFRLIDRRGRLAEFYPTDTLRLKLYSNPQGVRLLTAPNAILSSGVATAFVAVDRGGFYKIQAWLIVLQDSVTVLSQLFEVLRPIARVVGSFGVLPKLYDGSANAMLSANQLGVIVLQSDSGTVWVDSARVEYLSIEIGRAKRVKLRQCVLMGSVAAQYELSIGDIYSEGEIIAQSGQYGQFGGSNQVLSDFAHLDGRDLSPNLIILDSFLLQSHGLRSGDTISLQVEFQTRRNRRADYMEPLMAELYLAGTQTNSRGDTFLQGRVRNTIDRGLSPILNVWLGKGGSNQKIGVRSLVNGIWLHDTSVSFDVLPPFLELTGTYHVAAKGFDGNDGAIVDEFHDLQGVIALPAPFNDTFAPLSCQARFVSPSVGRQRQTILTEVQFPAAVRSLFEIADVGYLSHGDIHPAHCSGGDGDGDNCNGKFGVLLDGTLPRIHLEWQDPPGLSGVFSGGMLRAGDSMSCSIWARYQRNVIADFFDLITVQLGIQSSSATNRLHGGQVATFNRGQANFPYWTLHRSGWVIMGIQIHQNPEFPVSTLISDTIVLAKPLLTYRDWETDRKSTRLNSSH